MSEKYARDRLNLTITAALVLLALGDMGCGVSATPKSGSPEPVSAKYIEAEGLSNFYRVDSGLYRSAQPEAEGIKKLQSLGIKTVINLRQHHDDKELLQETQLEQIRIPVNTLRPTDKQIQEFLRIATDPARQPILVHCMHGADRTGMMVAAYRVAAHNWTKEQAIKEWTKGPYGFHQIFNRLPKMFRKLNIQPVNFDVSN